MCKYEPNSIKNICLTESVIFRIREQHLTAMKTELAFTLGLTLNAINRLLRKNSPNSSLTKLAALEIIARTLDMTTDQLIDVKIR